MIKTLCSLKKAQLLRTPLVLAAMLLLLSCDMDLDSSPKLNTSVGLVSLIVDGYTISPKFNTNVSEYSVQVSNDIEKVIINFLPLEGNMVRLNSRQTSNRSQLDLVEGNNEFLIEVLGGAQEKRGYRLVITRAIGS